VNKEELYKIIEKFAQEAGWKTRNSVSETIQIFLDEKRTVL